MDIRDAKLEDLESIHAIYRHYVATSVATLQEDLPLIDDIRGNFDKLKSLDMPYLVAEDSSVGKIAGYAYGGLFNDRSGYKHTAEDSIYLSPDYTGKGLGRRLLQDVFQKLKANGKKTIIAKISIQPSLQPEDLPSCRLHMSLGFREVGRLQKVGFKLGTPVDVIMLQLDLEQILV